MKKLNLKIVTINNDKNKKREMERLRKQIYREQKRAARVNETAKNSTSMLENQISYPIVLSSLNDKDSLILNVANNNSQVINKINSKISDAEKLRKENALLRQKKYLNKKN